MKTRRTQESSRLRRAEWGGSSILSLMNDREFLIKFSWYDEQKTRDKGCYKCSRDGCSLDYDNVYAYNCYNINNNFAKPTTEHIEKPYNRWDTHRIRTTIGSWEKVIGIGSGTFHANTGTFGRHPWANQDPIFYAHHASVFAVRDLALSSLVENGHASPPLYGLDEYLTNRGVPECPGNNPTDTTVFKNLVRYKIGQQLGSQHQWYHIMDMWSPERRDYEWVV